MQRIEDDLLIGDILDAGTETNYSRHGVDVVVKLSHEAPEAGPDSGYPNDVEVHDHAMIDGPQNDADELQRAVETVIDTVEADSTTFVHCSAGASRSVAVCAAARAILNDASLDASLDDIRRVRDVNLHPAVRENAEQAVTELRD